MPIPEVLIIPHLYVRGWGGQPIENQTSNAWFVNSKAVPLNQRLSLIQALETRFTDPDTCMVAYAPVNPDHTTWPRLLKPSLLLYPTVDATAPMLTTLLIDIDHDNHTPPPDGWVDSLLDKMPDDLRATISWYRTPNGMRLVAIPQEPVPLRLADSYTRAAHHMLEGLGIPTDGGTVDWTRLFRVPRAGNREYPMDLAAVRSGTPIAWHPEVLEEADCQMIGTAVFRTHAEADKFANEYKLTKDALRPLTKLHPNLADGLYHKTLSAAVGDRHKVLMHAALAIVSTYHTTDPVVPYRMLIDVARVMGKADAEVFGMCQWAAAGWDGMVMADREEQKTATSRAARAMGVTPTEVSRRLIIDLGAEQFVWDEGMERYTSGCSHTHQVLTTVDQSCPMLVADWFGSFADVMRAHSTKARKLVYTYNEGQAGFDTTTETMYVPVCRPDARLEPRFDAGVQGWLEALFDKDDGSPYYEPVMDWLAALPSLDMPVCALYIDGPPSVGKGLLTYGIARIWSRECRTVPYEELLEDFNETLTWSPIVYADEKVPHGKQQDSSVFRRMVGNSSFRINAKFKSPAVVEGYPRIIITANNAEALTFREDLDPNDINALRLRLGYVKVGSKGEGYLKALAKSRGMASARHMADAWRADGVIAQHILYLAQTRDFTPGSRFLVEGWDSPLIKHLPSNVGSAGLIMDLVIAAMMHPRPMRCVRWLDNHVYINNQYIAEEWDMLMPGERMPLSNSRMKALKSLSGGETRRLDIETGGSKRAQPRYWGVPADVVAQAAAERNQCDAQFVLDQCARTSEDGQDVNADAHETVLAL
jgi:hypothetical protein